MQVIFGRVIWTPRPSDQAPTLNSGFSAKSISSQGLGAGGCVILFLKGEDEAKKYSEQNFDLQPTALENGAMGATKFLEFQHFL